MTYKTTSEIAGVELILCKDESIWLLSSGQDKPLATHSQLGGYGNLGLNNRGVISFKHFA